MIAAFLDGITMRRGSAGLSRDQLFAVGITLLAILVRLPFLGDPAPDYDEQLYSLIGERMLRGDLPYIDLWDRKPFGLFALFAALHWIGGPSPQAYQIAAMFAVAAGGYLTFRLASRFCQFYASATVGILYVFALPVFGVPVGQSEVFYIPLSLAMVVLGLRIIEEPDRARVIALSLATVLIGGAILQIKYSVMPQCAFFGLVCLYRLYELRTPLNRLLAIGAILAFVGLLPTLLVVAYYYHLGALQVMIDANFVSIFDRGKLSAEFQNRYFVLLLFSALPYAVLAGAAILHVRQTAGSFSRGYLLAIGWAASSVFGFVMLGNVYIHYFAPVVPSLLVVAAPLLDRQGVGLYLRIILLAMATIAIEIPYQIDVSRSNRVAIARLTEEAAPYVGRGAGCLYVFDGPTALYQTTHSCLPTRFVYPDHLSNSMEQAALGTDSAREMARILAQRPAAIVTASEPVVPQYNQPNYRQVSAAIARDYTRTGTVFLAPRLLYLNVRNDLLDAERKRTNEPSPGNADLGKK